MMTMIVLVNGTSFAAAMCVHRDAADHAAALGAEDSAVAAKAHAEDAAGSVAAKRGTLADAGSLMLPAFLLPAGADALREHVRSAAPRMYADDLTMPGRGVAPLLEPPAKQA